MKAFIHLMLAVAFAAVVSVSVFADKDKVKKEITLADDTTVNGTMVKAGDYELTFDEQANEISIMKGSKVVAKAPVRVETQNTKAKSTQYRVVSNELVSVTLGGSTKQLVLSNSGTSSSQ
jgi:hypothetical protein